jgi:monomeric sarcosine oxidase
MHYEVIIAGGGIMGLATAYSLLRHGVRGVLVLERYILAHDRAASTDDTKAIRYEYGEQAIYSRMVDRAIPMWRDLEARAALGTDLYVNCGVVCWGRGDAPHTRTSYATLREMGLPVRAVSPQELAAEYPQFDAADMSFITINPEGGFLRASACGLAYAKLIRQMGGEIREGHGLVDLVAGDGGVEVVVEGGERVRAPRVALCVGAWGANVLPRLGITAPLTAHKQQVVYLEGLGQEYAPGKFPVFLNLDHDFYGFPLDARGLLKASLHRPGPLQDPDVPQTPDPEFEAEVREMLRTYIPGAANAPTRLSRMCMYSMTPDEDFILDHHPAHRNVAIAAGFSGHGFKFGPVIGDLNFSLLMDEEPDFPLEGFRLGRFQQA